MGVQAAFRYRRVYFCKVPVAFAFLHFWKATMIDPRPSNRMYRRCQRTRTSIDRITLLGNAEPALNMTLWRSINNLALDMLTCIRYRLAHVKCQPYAYSGPDLDVYLPPLASGSIWSGHRAAHKRLISSSRASLRPRVNEFCFPTLLVSATHPECSQKV